MGKHGLSSAVAIEIFNDDTVVDNLGILEFVHMKPSVQYWIMNSPKWQNTIHSNYNKNGELFLANIRQHNLFHYVEKDFLTDAMISTLEGLVNDR